MKVDTVVAIINENSKYFGYLGILKKVDAVMCEISFPIQKETSFFFREEFALAYFEPQHTGDEEECKQ